MENSISIYFVTMQTRNQRMRATAGHAAEKLSQGNQLRVGTPCLIIPKISVVGEHYCSHSLLHMRISDGKM